MQNNLDMSSPVFASLFARMLKSISRENKISERENEGEGEILSFDSINWWEFVLAFMHSENLFKANNRIY